MNRTKLKQITIKGYKSISYAKPLKLDIHEINILLGANGAGKSNMISTQSPTLIDGFDMDDVAIIERDEDNRCTVVNKLNKDEYEKIIRYE